MKSDINGCSTTEAGREQYEQYYDSTLKGWRIQYDYRTPEGKLFSCIAKTLEQARDKRRRWMESWGIVD